MSPRWIVALALTAAACGNGNSPSSARAGSMHTYRLVARNDSSSPPIPVSIAVPEAWTENVADPGAPVFTVPGVAGGSRVTLTALALTSADPAARMTKAIDLQFGDDLASATRTELGGGRVWMQRNEPAMVHARVFVPFDRGVVMGVAMIRNESADRVPEIRAVLETMTVGKP